MSQTPTATERYFFDNNGYLVLERFLDPEHVARLTAALERTLTRRRAAPDAQTALEGDSTRIFYILGDDPLFLDLLDWPALMPYVRELLNAHPHHHASDAIHELGLDRPGMGWHIDGHDNGYRGLGWPIPLLQLKVGYFLSDMSAPGQGNLCVIPGSHLARSAPPPEDLRRPEPFAGAVELCVPAGTAVLFHNALWHSGGPWRRPDGRRIVLYYAYEHHWMLASPEHGAYPAEFYKSLSPERRTFFHNFCFEKE